jgi:glycosyltransferase involved in cell wall biosynthesis
VDVTITCIIPTMGRETLLDALASCSEADEVIVVVDDARAGEWQPLGDNVRVLHVPECNRGGHSSRNHAMPHATGTHLCFLDDDDIYLPGAIEAMRKHACDRPVIFKMDHPAHGLLWREKELTFGNVSTQMFLVPNDPDRLGVWAHHMPELPQPGGDFTFIRECVEKMGEPLWRDELVARYDAQLPSLAIVTPWLDHPELIDGYMDAMTYLSPRDELIVVDNGSTPPLSLPGIRLEENQGFAAASNVGLEAAEADAVLFLNNDVLATRWDWLNQIRLALEPGWLVGAQMRYDRHADVDGHSFPYLDGWCLAGMREELLDLGGFDESLAEPAYYSDNLLCLRARMAGMSLRQVDVGLVHLASRTAGPAQDERVSAATLANRERYLIRAREALVAA